jgi:hypothetical protein
MGGSCCTGNGDTAVGVHVRGWQESCHSIEAVEKKGKERNTNSPIEWCNRRMGTQQTEHRADTYRCSAQEYYNQ